MSEDECTRPFFRARHPSSRFVQFSGHGVSRKHRDWSPTFPDLLNERTDAKKIDQRENRDGRVSEGFFFDDAGNYSRLARVDVDGELLDGRTDTSGVYLTHPIFRWSIQFPRQLTPGPATEGFTRTRDRTYVQNVAGASALAYATHAGARMNFDKTARISTEDRTSARRRVWRRQFNEIQPGLGTADLRGKRGILFFYTRVVSPRSLANEIDTFHEPVINYWSVPASAGRHSLLALIEGTVGATTYKIVAK